MKLTKIFALILVLASLMSLLTGCAMGNNSETTPEVTMPPEDPTKTAKAHLIFMDIDGNVFYSSEEEDGEIYVYTSPWLDPTILNFVEDYCFMNDNKLECTIDSKTNVLKTITHITKKEEIAYKGGVKYTIPETGKKADTYWACYVNGKELDGQLDSVMVEDGSTIIIRLAYVGQEIKF